MFGKLFEKRELEMLWPVYLALILDGLLGVTIMTWVVYFVGKGMSYTQAAALMAIFFGTTMVLQIPSGAIADVFGRKKIVILGWIAGGIFWFFIPMTESFILLCLLVFFSMAFWTLTSGSTEAWAVDLLKKHKLIKYTKKFFINLQSFKNLGIVLAGVAGTIIIASLGIDWLFYFGAVSTITGGLVLLFMEEDFKPASNNLWKKITGTVNGSKKGIGFLLHSQIPMMLTAAAFFYSLSIAAFVGWQPFMLEQGIPVAFFTSTLSIGGVIGIVIPQAYKFLERKFEENIVLAVLMSLQAAVLLSVWLITGPILALIAFIATNFLITNLYEPIRLDYFQQFIPSKLRATVTSVDLTILSIPAIAGIISGGFIVELLGPRIAIVVAGLVLLPSIILYLKSKSKHKMPL